MPIELMLPTSMTMAIISWAFIFVWYIHPRLKSLPSELIIEPLLFLHSFRHIGLMFLIPGVTATLLDSRFAMPAAYGDLITAVLAFIAIIAIRLDLFWKFSAIWVFNIVGLLDLLNAVMRGLLYTNDGDLGATYWIPAMIVPLLVVSHIYIFVLLLKRRR